MPIPPLSSGSLPMGRWACTEQEVGQAFTQGTGRGDIWSEWQQLTGALRQVVGGVAAAWLSGSFVTNKPDPGDIDCLYVIDTAHLAAVTDAQHQAFIDVVTRSRVKARFGLRVDSYILEWAPYQGPQPPVWANGYLQTRGYWDDFWGRIRDPDARLASIPRRGYLEVILDGYH